MTVQLQIPCPIRISPSIKYLTQEYYSQYYDEYWIDNHYYEYTFIEWYFFYTRKLKLLQIYAKLIIDSDVYDNGCYK